MHEKEEIVARGLPGSATGYEQFSQLMSDVFTKSS